MFCVFYGSYGWLSGVSAVLMLVLLGFIRL